MIIYLYAVDDCAVQILVNSNFNHLSSHRNWNCGSNSRNDPIVFIADINHYHLFQIDLTIFTDLLTPLSDILI